jgi:methionyl-tRNA formyltransferase
VKVLALEHGLDLRQPLHFREAETLEALQAVGADVFVVAAYGLILPQAVLALPRLGAVNVHASLLPELRGAAPIERAVMRGDRRTGITIMRVEQRLDSGPILLQRALGIGFEQNAGELREELAQLGARLLTEALERLERGGLTPVPQDESRASYAAKLEKKDGLLDFRQSALEVHNRARGVTPAPGEQIFLRRLKANGEEGEPLRVIVLKGRPLPETGEEARQAGPGLLLPPRQGRLPVACADALYGIERLKPAGGGGMEAEAFARGYLQGYVKVFADSHSAL